MKSNRVLLIALSFCVINVFGMEKTNQKHSGSKKQNCLQVDDVRSKNQSISKSSRERIRRSRKDRDTKSKQVKLSFASPSSDSHKLEPTSPKDIELILEALRAERVKLKKELPRVVPFYLVQHKKSGIREKTSSLEILAEKKTFYSSKELDMLTQHCDASLGIGSNRAFLYVREPYSDQENKSDQEKKLVNHFFTQYKFYQPEHFPRIPKDSKK
jgi:hypothetical protein